MTTHVTQPRQVSGTPEVLLLAEAAAIARQSPATLRDAIRRGELAAVRVGHGSHRRHVRVTRDALIAWLGLDFDRSHGERVPTHTEAGPRPVVAGPASSGEVRR